MLGFNKLVGLLTESVSHSSAQELKNRCTQLGMKPIEHYDDEVQAVLGSLDYDNIFNFVFITQDNKSGVLQIIEKEGEIIQAGFQLIYQEFFLFKKINKHFKELKDICDNFYKLGSSDDMGMVKIINYSNNEQVSYLSRIKMENSESINFKVGNRMFWG